MRTKLILDDGSSPDVRSALSGRQVAGYQQVVGMRLVTEGVNGEILWQMRFAPAIMLCRARVCYSQVVVSCKGVPGRNVDVERAGPGETVMDALRRRGAMGVGRN